MSETETTALRDMRDKTDDWDSRNKGVIVPYSVEIAELKAEITRLKAENYALDLCCDLKEGQITRLKAELNGAYERATMGNIVNEWAAWRDAIMSAFPDTTDDTIIGGAGPGYITMGMVRRAAEAASTITALRALPRFVATPSPMENREKSKHTPGPWEIQPYRSWDKDIFIADRRIRVDNDDVAEGEGEANACLISAAPEMLEALKLLLSSAHDYQTGVKEAEEAINKATGTQETI
jgi:hypothetical protein